MFHSDSMEGNSRRDSARHFLFIIDRQAHRCSSFVIVSMIQKEAKKKKKKKKDGKQQNRKKKRNEQSCEENDIRMFRLKLSASD